MTKNEYAIKTKEILDQLTDIIEAGMKDGFEINFNIATDSVSKKATVTKLTIAESFV